MGFKMYGYGAKIIIYIYIYIYTFIYIYIYTFQEIHLKYPTIFSNSLAFENILILKNEKTEKLDGNKFIILN